MSDVISVKVSKISKVYKLYEKPSERLQEALHPFRKKYHKEFHALKDVSFEITKGQIVGIIGKNGSGKSTLLKIITGVLTPSSGSLQVNGKVAALLELGAGFNPELTGLENIYLNGSMMGFSRAQMEPLVANIVEFAEIGEFVDQPVRMYSSGMFVRLAFAVAINVDPDILIVDEALSVGDIRFQQKCFRKIKEFFERGKTVIFVGHDLAAINSFCTVCYWINEGSLISKGTPQEIIKEYTSFMAYGMQSEEHLIPKKLVGADGWIETSSFESFGDMESKIVAIRVVDQLGNSISTVRAGESVDIEISVSSSVCLDKPIFGIMIKDRLGNRVFGGNTFVHDIKFDPVGVGDHRYRLSFKFPTITNGDYTLTMSIADGDQINHVQKHWIHDCFIFKVLNEKMRYRIGDVLVMEDNFFFKKIN